MIFYSFVISLMLPLYNFEEDISDVHNQNCIDCNIDVKIKLLKHTCFNNIIWPVGRK